VLTGKGLVEGVKLLDPHANRLGQEKKSKKKKDLEEISRSYGLLRYSGKKERGEVGKREDRAQGFRRRNSCQTQGARKGKCATDKGDQSTEAAAKIKL